MLDTLEENEEPACDFGVFITGNNHETNGLISGDLLISVDDEDCLEKTAAQVHHFLGKLNPDSMATITLGKKDFKRVIND